MTRRTSYRGLLIILIACILSACSVIPRPTPPPANAPLEHALNIDFVNESQGPGARVAVELSAEAARSLVETINAVLERAEAGGHLE